MHFDWPNIETVLLDMDGTLLDLNFDTSFWLDYLPVVWATVNGVDIEQGRARLAPMFKEHAGTLNWYSVDFWSEELGLDIMHHKQDLADKIQYRPTAQLFLQRCRRESNDVRLVTNAHRKIYQMKEARTQIGQYFDEVLCSHELNRPKEDPLFWHDLQAHQHFDPNKTLFIDDNDSVLESAQQFGIKHLFSIAKPDSKRARSSPSRFEMLERLA